MTILTDELLASLEPSTRDVNEACLLPPLLYTSEAFFEFEKDAVYGHSWLCVGREAQIPEPGDWYAFDIVDEPLLVTRDKSGTVRVLSAVCQHRGMVVAEGSGSGCSKFTCPYHHWSYALDGRLLGAPAMEKAVGFDKACYSLAELRTETWQGFVFATFDPDIAPLAPTLTELDPFLEHYELPTSTYRAGKRLTDLPWNWKVMLENFNDPYHASRLHGPLQTFAPSGMSDFFDWRDDLGHVSRVQHFTELDGSFNPTKRAILPVFPSLTEDERRRGLFVLIPPTLALAVVPDEVAYFIVKPQGANGISIDIDYCLDPSAVEDPMFEYLFAAAEAGVDNFNIQDVYADAMVQRGLRSRFGPRGRYSWQEGTLPQFNRWLVQRYRAAWPASVTTAPTSANQGDMA
jgi:phenylpropionate dioxygenase-like ring-hydroxylating dioxygenase large terminal subunit